MQNAEAEPHQAVLQLALPHVPRTEAGGKIMRQRKGEHGVK